MAQKFLTDIEVTRGLVDSSGDLGVAGQVLSSTGSGTNWITNEANSTVVYLDEFTGDNSTVDFTISVSVTDENITQVYIDGVYQNKDTYSVSNTTLTFSTAPPLNADIEVITFSTATTSDDLAAGSVIIPVKNTHTASIAKGEPVYITGNVGSSARLQIAPADASNSAKMPAAGLLLQTLAVNAEGYVITGGYLRNITTDTIDGTSTTSNDTVYVKSGGGLTMTKPTGTNLIQNIAKVARSSSANSGSLLVSSILRTNDVPNITNDYFWLGNSSGVATPTEFTSTARGLLSVGAEGTAAGDGNLAYNNSSGVFTYTPPVLGGLSGTTDNITEGSTNLYYTDARSRSSISAGGDLSYNSTTGVMSYTTPTTIASLSNHDTDDLSEGSTNLYYTDTRVGTYLTNNSYATQSYVNTQVSNLVDSAPSTLDTLNELAAALGDDANFSTTVTNSIATKLPLAGGTMTGRIIQSQHSTTLGNSSYSTEAAITAQASNTTNVYPGYGFHKSGQLGLFLYATDRSTLRQRGDDGTDVAIWNTGDFSSTNVSNWNTAYGWGNHASANYASSSHTHAASDITSGNLAAARNTPNLVNIGSTSDASGIYFRGTTEIISGEGWCTAQYAYNHNDGFLFLNRNSSNTAFPTFHIGGWNNAGYAGYSDADGMITLTRSDGSKNGGSTYAGTGLSNTSYWTRMVKTTAKTIFKDAQGSHEFDGDVRGTIFYNSNDTNSYLNQNQLVLRSGDPTIYMRDTNHRSVALHNNSNRFYVLGAPIDSTSYTQINGVWPWYVQLDTNDVYTGNIGYAGGSYRAPIFYDKDNTAYYLNPSSSTISLNANGELITDYAVRVSAVDGGGNITPSTDHIRLSGYGIIGNRGTVYITNSNSSGYVKIGVGGAHNAGIKFSVSSSGTTTTGIGTATSSYRAPIFYDTDNTGYYVDINSSSNFNHIMIGNGNANNGAQSLALNDGEVAFRDDADHFHKMWYYDGVNIATNRSHGHVRIWGESSNTIRNASTGATNLIADFDCAGDVIWLYNDTRSPIFRDSANTSYYVDPGNGANLNGNTRITNTKFGVSTTGTFNFSSGYGFHTIENGSSNEPICMFYHQVGTTAVQFYGINVISAAAHNNTTSRFFLGQGGSTERIKIYSNGNIQNSNNSYGQLSDINLKENIVDATPKLDDINQVRVVNFNYIGDVDEETNTPNKQIGVVAQELEEIFPGMVYECGDTETPTKSVKYSVFVPMLIKAVQELTQEVQTLKDQINGIN